MRLVTACLAAGVASGEATSAPATSGEPAHPAADTVLRLARSGDGLEFTDLGRVLAVGASAPDLTRLPDGTLLALFDYWLEREQTGRVVMAVSQSKDDGKSWSPLRLVRMRELDGRWADARHGDLTEVADGRYRLYFADKERQAKAPPHAEADARATIRSAITRNGIEYLVDRRADVGLAGRSDLHPTALRIEGQLHLYAAALQGQTKSSDAARAVQHVVSQDGRRFSRAAPVGTPPVRFVGSLVPIEGGIRAYVSSDKGISSLISEEGRYWKPEEGVRLAGGWDPAVTRMEDGSFLMIYCLKRSAASVEGGRALGDGGAAVDGGRAAAGEALSVDAERVDAQGQPDWLVAPPSEQELALYDQAKSRGEFGEADELPEWDSLLAGVDPAAGGSWSEERSGEPLLDLAPRPDPQDPVDYVEWFEQNMLDDDVFDNAFDAYSEFMPGQLNPTGPSLDWPELTNMFSDRDYDGPPGPWDPAEHPEWEASDQAAQEVLERFRESGWCEGYQYRPQFSEERMIDTPDGQPLLIEMLLPSLSPHGKLAKAAMAGAWRTEEGRVAPDRMLEAMETTLRNARHLSSGPTIIENLVATAERNLVQRNARWALKHGVFDEHGLEEALDVLMEHDYDDTDPARFMRGEHAVEMQTAQYLFDERDPAGLEGRVAQVASMSLESGAETIERVTALDSSEVREALDAFDAHAREMTEQIRTGYPRVRAADLDATAQKYVHTNALTELLLPSLSRVQVIRTRNEASRRATQLAYATHLFEASNGRWPESLDELPEEFGQEMRTDPFTGGYFGYRLTANGPMIHSASENGLDDGGIHSPRWNDEITNDAGSDDYVFWPPQDKPL